VIECIHHNVGNILGTPNIHIIGNVIEVEEVTQKIGAYSQLRIRGVGVAQGREQSALETVKPSSPLLAEVKACEKPLLRRVGDMFPIPIEANVESTI